MTFSFRPLVVSSALALALAVPMFAAPSLARADHGEHGKKGQHGQHGQHGPKGTPVEADGKFKRWLVGPHGQIHGLQLQDGTIVAVPPPAVKDTSLHDGDVLHVTARAHNGANGPVWVHPKITKGGNVVVDVSAMPPRDKRGPDARAHGPKDTSKLTDMNVTGTVTTLWAGPHDRVHAVILSDGTVAYGGFKTDLASLGLKKGDAITVTGKGGSYPLGRALRIVSVKLPNGETKTL